MTEYYVWEIRNPDGASLGLEVARGKSAPCDVMLAHALPERVDVEVRDDAGEIVAAGANLSDSAVTPIARLDVAGGAVSRRNIWPDDSELELPVILPGGEVGILKTWWNAADEREWRWNVEFHNRVQG